MQPRQPEQEPIQIKMKPSTDMGGGSSFHMKTSFDGGGGGGLSITRPTRREKLYNANMAIYVYPDGKVEIGKNRNGEHGEATIETAIKYFSKIISELQLKNTNLSMFKEGLSELLQEAIQNTLKGEHYERAIRAESAEHGLDSNRSP